MDIKKLRSKAAIQILKPVSEVYDAIVNPEKMSQYFISKSTGKMEEGKVVYWGFPEFEGEFPTKVLELVTNQKIVFDWTGGNTGSG